MVADGFARGGIDIKAKCGGEADGAQDANGVFDEAAGGIADDAQQVSIQIAQAAGVVDNGEVGDVVEEGVDGEVTAKGIFFGTSKNIVAQDKAVVGDAVAVFVAALGLGGQCAEGGDFNGFVVKVDMSQTEAAADEAAVTKYPLHIFRRGVGGDVKIFRVASEQNIANAAACEIGCVSDVFEAVEHFNCGRADLLAADGVVGAGYNLRIHKTIEFPRFGKM